MRRLETGSKRNPEIKVRSGVIIKRDWKSDYFELMIPVRGSTPYQ